MSRLTYIIWTYHDLPCLFFAACLCRWVRSVVWYLNTAPKPAARVPVYFLLRGQVNWRPPHPHYPSRYLTYLLLSFHLHIYTTIDIYIIFFEVYILSPYVYSPFHPPTCPYRLRCGHGCEWFNRERVRARGRVKSWVRVRVRDRVRVRVRVSVKVRVRAS